MTSVLVVHKYYTDAFYPNHYIAEIAGISIRELNRLEVQFLSILDFNLTVTATEHK